MCNPGERFNENMGNMESILLFFRNRLYPKKRLVGWTTTKINNKNILFKKMTIKLLFRLWSYVLLFFMTKESFSVSVNQLRFKFWPTRYEDRKCLRLKTCLQVWWRDLHERKNPHFICKIPFILIYM